MSWWPPWRHDDRDGRHAPTDIERASAEVFGRIKTITDQLERVIREREQQRDRDGDG